MLFLCKPTATSNWCCQKVHHSSLMNADTPLSSLCSKAASETCSGVCAMNIYQHAELPLCVAFEANIFTRKTTEQKHTSLRLIYIRVYRILKNNMDVNINQVLAENYVPLIFIHSQSCPPPFLYHLPQFASTLRHFNGDHLQFWSGLLLSSPMKHHQPDDTNAAMIDIHMLPLALYNPLFLSSTQQHLSTPTFWYTMSWGQP